jgi:hypothetical protein
MTGLLHLEDSDRRMARRGLVSDCREIRDRPWGSVEERQTHQIHVAIGAKAKSFSMKKQT